MSSLKGKQLIRKILTGRTPGRIPLPLNVGIRPDTLQHETKQKTEPLDEDRRWEIISAYGHLLEKCSSPVEREEDLPYPKKVIRSAIYEELRENPDSEFRSHLEIAFAQLESFLPQTDYRVIEDFKYASKLALDLARSGDPVNVIASARILKQGKGERALRIQEKISEKMRERLAQIRSARPDVSAL